MKKILFSIIFILATFTSFAQQNGGDISNIKLKNSAGTKDDWWRFGHGAMIYDSVGNVYQAAIKLKIDTVYNLLNSGIRTILDSSTQRSTVKISGTVPVSGTVTVNAGTNLNTSLLALASKQPALGTAGTPSADVITIQGDTGMRPVKIDGSAVTQPVSSKTVIYDSTVTASAMTITNLSALASSATAGWQSARVSNLSAMASDYKVTVRLSMANTAPANDKSIYVYAVGWGTTDGGTTWYSATGGTTTSPSGSEGTYTIVSAAPTNFRLLGILNYQTQDMNPCDNFLLSNAFGNVIPDAWSLVIINYSGAALETTSGANNLVYYSPVYKTQR